MRWNKTERPEKKNKLRQIYLRHSWLVANEGAYEGFFPEDDSASCSSLFHFILFYFFGNRGVSMLCVFQKKKTKFYLLSYVLNYVLLFLLYDIVMGGCYTQVR